MLDEAKDRLWPEKYRPTSLEEYTFQNDMHKRAFTEIVTSGVTPHLLLTGIQGTGKSAIAKIIVEACIEEDDMDFDLLKLNASDHNSVDDIREQVKSHIMSYANGDYKIVWLEEADYLSPNAQGILRDYMEEYEQHCRFILSCNHLHRIIAPLRSRCQHYSFLAGDKNLITEAAAVILMKEQITFDLATLDLHVNLRYPDMRAILNSLSQFSYEGVLHSPISESNTDDSKMDILDAIQNDEWESLLALCGTVLDDEWEEVYEFLYQNLKLSPKFTDFEKWGQGIVIIAEHLLNHPTVAKPHINAASLLIQLGQI